MTRYYSESTGGFYSDMFHAARPEDAVEISDDQHAQLMAAQAHGQIIQAGVDGKPVAVARPGPTPQQLSLSLSGAVQAHIDATAQSMGYDSILTAVSYASEPAVPEFQAQAIALRAWRSVVWLATNVVLNQVLAGGVPPTADDLVASLPKFNAPA